MKLHEYLWEYIDHQNQHDCKNDLTAQAHMREFLGDEQIISDSNGKPMNEREARSVWGRNEKRLLAAYEMGSKPLFASVCMDQQMSDDEWQKLKEEMWAKENQDGEGTGDCQECQIPEAEQ